MITKMLDPKLFDEDMGAQKIHLSVDSLTDIHADALIPDLRYGYTSNILLKSQF